MQPFAQFAWLRVLQAAGVPEQVPPVPASFGVQTHPSATQFDW